MESLSWEVETGPMSNESDLRAIDELRAMARVYANHGFSDKASQLIKLAEAMETRIERSAEREARVVDMSEFRAEHDAAAAEEEVTDGRIN
jgi:hypothetical protein